MSNPFATELRAPITGWRTMRLATLPTMLMLAMFATPWAVAGDEGDVVRLGSYEMTVPSEWQRRQPRSRIVSYEFAVPAAEGDKQPGRVTIMAAGGSVEQNIARWFDQFKQPDGRGTKDVAKTEKKTIAGQSVHLVDISGTFIDRPRPFGPGVERPKYRMLGAIIVTPDAQLFVKFTGPERTVAAAADDFRQMIESLRKR